jgi:hypothetical protein
MSHDAERRVKFENVTDGRRSIADLLSIGKKTSRSTHTQLHFAVLPPSRHGPLVGVNPLKYLVRRNEFRTTRSSNPPCRFVHIHAGNPRRCPT